MAAVAWSAILCMLGEVSRGARYDAEWSAHVASMASVVQGALGVCIGLYFAVGFFGEGHTRSRSKSIADNDNAPKLV